MADRNCGQPQPVAIIADDREAGSGVVEALRRLGQVDVQVQRLTVGDYFVDDHLLVERKTFKDLAVSIIDGRLFRQAIRLANASYIPMLIIEGSRRELDQMRIRREALQGALINVSLILGIPVLRSQHPYETAQLILMANRQVDTVSRGAIQRHGYRPKGKLRRQLFVLQSLPGIGPKRADQLLDRFGSVSAVITASTEQLAAVDSIGKKTAENIKWTVE